MQWTGNQQQIRSRPLPTARTSRNEHNGYQRTHWKREETTTSVYDVVEEAISSTNAGCSLLSHHSQHSKTR